MHHDDRDGVRFLRKERRKVDTVARAIAIGRVIVLDLDFELRDAVEYRFVLAPGELGLPVGLCIDKPVARHAESASVGSVICVVGRRDGAEIQESFEVLYLFIWNGDLKRG